MAGEIRQTIGRVKCPICGKWGEVRRDKRGKLYYLSDAGKITPNLPAGQEWLLKNAIMYSKSECQKVNSNDTDFGRRVLPEKMQDGIKLKTDDMPTEDHGKPEAEKSGWTLLG